MQEVFKNIIEKLNAERNPIYRKDGSVMGDKRHIEINRAIEIVNQVAAEYNTDGEQHEKPKTNADRIRSMSDEELAEFLCKVKADYQWLEHEFPSEEDCGIWEEWLQSEVEE